ncbi:CRTAC1 family protein [bacterium]|nr:CRTAC1 family protein [bacterium]
MKTQLARFIPLMIAGTVLFAGYKVRQDMGIRVVPRSDIPVDFTFVDTTEKMGIHFKHEVPVLDLNGNTRLVFFGAGGAVADFNGDGWMDILLPTSKPDAKSHLYLNEKGKSFREVSQEWGVDQLGEKGAPNAPVVFDFDNDGRSDLYIARMGCSLLYRNTGTQFEKVPLDDCKNSFGAVPFDADGDGLLDLYVLRYWPALNYFKLDTVYAYADMIDDSVNGGTNELYFNKGNRFERAPAGKAGEDPHWSIDAAVGRFSTEDENLRIYTANDYGRDTAFIAKDGGLIPDHKAKIPFERRSGMSVSLGDLDGSGFPFLYISNIYTPEYNVQENFLWKMNKGKFTDYARTYGLHSCGWAWGSAFADFNLDGRQDIYIANGMITGKSKQEYSYLSGLNNALPDVVRNSTVGWPPIKDRSWSGRQIDCLMLNTEDGFKNVANQVGIRESWDGRGVSLIDIDNNGALDVLVTAEEGSPHLFYNTVNPGRHWVGFNLVGRKSNRDGVGTRIEVRQKDRSYFRWGSGGRTGAMASSDPRLHFGLANSEKLVVEVQWPSGTKQVFNGVEPGQYYTIDESVSALN